MTMSERVARLEALIDQQVKGRPLVEVFSREDRQELEAEVKRLQEELAVKQCALEDACDALAKRDRVSAPSPLQPRPIIMDEEDAAAAAVIQGKNGCTCRLVEDLAAQAADFQKLATDQRRMIADRNGQVKDLKAQLDSAGKRIMEQGMKLQALMREREHNGSAAAWAAEVGKLHQRIAELEGNEHDQTKDVVRPACEKCWTRPAIPGCRLCAKCEKE